MGRAPAIWGMLIVGGNGMAAPRGTYRAPAGGPLAGRVYLSQPGDAPTAPYNRYIQERAQAFGYSGYTEQRRLQRKIQNDNTYQWALEKTLARRFDLELYTARNVKDVLKGGKTELAEMITVPWSREMGITGYSYKDAITRLFVLAEKEDWNPRAYGPYARLLELMGIRVDGAPYQVGDTPT